MIIKRIFVLILVLSFALPILCGQNRSIYGINFYKQDGSLAKKQRAYFKEFLLLLGEITPNKAQDSLDCLPLLSTDRYNQTPIVGLYKVESVISLKANYYINHGHLSKKNIFIVELFSVDSNSLIPYHVYVLSPKDKHPKGIGLKTGNTYQFELKQIFGEDYRNLTSRKTPVGDYNTYEHCFYRHYYVKAIPLQNRIYFESTNLNGIYYIPQFDCK